MSRIPQAVTRRAIYASNYALCTLNAGVEEVAGEAARIITVNAPTYKAISDPNGVPWQAIGAIHYMECDLNFARHLANGDTLLEDTKHVPARIMYPKEPPYSFVDAGLAALANYKRGWGFIVTGGVDATLQFCEQWNGLGYWELDPPKPSPYLWSGTTAYTSGKFTSDGSYDQSAVSKQLGVVAILKALGVK